MAWRIVKQPNGLFARFSDVVDRFTHVNITQAEALEICLADLGRRDALEKVQRAVDDIEPWTVDQKGSGRDRFNDCIETVRIVHGEEDAREILLTAQTAQTSI